MSVAGIIAARGGSKGLPNKHLRILNGKPLLSWTIKQAFHSSLIDTFYLTTDCEKIIQIAIDEGIPSSQIIQRPESLAEDNTLIIDVIDHALDYILTKEKSPDYLALLEPTSPLRKPSDIDNAVKKLLTNKQFDSLITLGEFRDHPFLAKQLEGDKYKSFIKTENIVSNRQTYDHLYFPYGVIYVCKTNSLIKERSFYTKNSTFYLINDWQCFEVDDIIDFHCIEAMMKLKSNFFDR